MPPKRPLPAVPATCRMCCHNLDVVNGLRRKTAEPTTFSCQNRRCRVPQRWHVACVDRELGADQEAFLECEACGTETTVRRDRSWWRWAFGGWIGYPRWSHKLPWMVVWVLNRVVDVAVALVGFYALALSYAAQPYTAGNYVPGVGDIIVNQALPRQVERLARQALDANEPALATATYASAWLAGWITVAVVACVVKFALQILRLRKSPIRARGMSVE